MTFKVVIFDMDGVIFRDINFWMELHKKFGTLEEGKILTQQYLNSNYDKLVEEVVAKLWKGKDAKPYYDLVNSIEYLPGVKEMMAHVTRKGYVTAIVSASSIDVARRVQRDYGIDHLFANTLVIKDNKVAGEFIGLTGEGKEKKAKVIRELCKTLEISPKDCIYVGDSRYDIEAFKEVGIGIAFNCASEELKAVATHIVEGNDLSNVIRYIP